MSKGYLIAHIRVHDKEKFEEFKSMAMPLVAEFGGRLLARNPAPNHREGDLRGLTVLIEFDDLAAATRFYESDGYTAAIKVREQCSETDLMLVEGL